MTIVVKKILDSVNEYGDRLTTLQLKYPRFIHAEFMTHRVFSRNASSSRAIPVKKIIETIKNDPVFPSYWGKNQPGMQAFEELDEDTIIKAKNVWESAMNSAIKHAEEFIELGVHKQIANRILEPFSHINVIVSSTNWSNFYALRRHKDAQPEIRLLANAMYNSMYQEIQKTIENSQPKLLKHGEWHLPYINDYELDNDLDILQKMSAARCARVSYLLHDGKVPSIEDDLNLFERLMGNSPIHATPVEHQGMPDRKIGLNWENPNLHGNFTGFIQYRKTFPNECI